MKKISVDNSTEELKWNLGKLSFYALQPLLCKLGILFL